MNDQKSKIVLSYAHEDIGMAKKIYHDLKRYGIDVWFDYENISAGQSWKTAIEAIIKQSKYCLALLSSNTTTQNGLLKNELKFILELLSRHAELHIDLLTVRIDECELSLTDSDIKFIDLFPEDQYRTGLKRILYILSPSSLSLRNNPMPLSETDVSITIRQHDFFDKYLNPEGLGFNHQYQELTIKEKQIIFDQKTNLVWQKGGSEKDMIFKKTEEWILFLNQRGHAGFEDWRLPTLEEAMSILEPNKKNAFLFIDPLFEDKQTWIWTADPVKDQSQMWAVHFLFGRCNVFPLDANLFVRAVRSGAPVKE